ncbi:metallophosphoesterase [Amycolatopsis plumensis]|uniref:Metallophosphoesterase n=1 Tax=Amycolatopsis plumensis TaxID=236508 RepID=A0ABV5U7J8_9PSEU
MATLGTARLFGAATIMLLSSAVLPATAHGAPAVDAAEKFSIVVIPDTQYAAERYPAAFNAQGQWIKDNRVARNIRYVVHEGDIVDDSDQTGQWANANSALGRLDGNTPYILGVGNHDMDAMPKGQDPAVVRDAAAFNANFPVTRFSGLPSFGASYPAGKNDNSYHTFTAGGTSWLILALKYAPTDAEIAWGSTVIAAHPRHQVMVVTHAYQSGTTKDSVGKKLWTQLVSKHANVSFVFSGHYTAQGLITEKGMNGNTVYQVQADYQNILQLAPNSYFRVMNFDPAARTVAVTTYSPYLNKYLTDAKNQFTLTNVAFLPAVA